MQILIALLKEHEDKKKIVASPGSTNVTFVGSIQQDPFFEIYSSVDDVRLRILLVGCSGKWRTSSTELHRSNCFT